jgi:hypothetical protein
MKRLSSILMLIVSAFSIGTVQGQVIMTLCENTDGTFTELGSYVDAFPNFDFPTTGIVDVRIDVSGGEIVHWDSQLLPQDYQALLGATPPLNVYVTTNDVNDVFLGTVDNIIHKKQPHICLVTSTVNGDMEIVVEPSSILGYDTLGIYRTGGLGEQYIGQIDAANNTTVVDVAVPLTNAWQYVARGGADCPDSESHQPIYLWNNNGQLNWEDYLLDGEEYTELSGYDVLQLDTLTFAWNSVGSVAIANDNWFNVSVTPSYYPDAIYQLQAMQNSICDLGSGKQSAEDGIVLSNPTSIPMSTSITDEEIIATILINPSDGLHLTTNKPVDVSIYTMLGQWIAMHPKTTRVDAYLENGAYLIVLNTGHSTFTKKLIVSK